MNSIEFLNAVEMIAATNPAYRTGGIGKDGTCDCVGLIMGAMYQTGRRDYPTHSSNYFARYETSRLLPLLEADLQPGMLVYKAREDDGRLNDRYKPGGRYHTGDLLDYYHVGVVESVQPLRIVHCTSTPTADGIMRDSSTKGWTHAGFAAEVDYGSAPEQTEEPVGNAVVYAANGKTVNLRSRPNTSAQLVDRVPVGTVVQVAETARNDKNERWSRVTVNGKTGYMMADYLRGKGFADADEVTVTMPKAAAQALLEALKTALNA